MQSMLLRLYQAISSTFVHLCPKRILVVNAPPTMQWLLASPHRVFSKASSWSRKWIGECIHQLTLLPFIWRSIMDRYAETFPSLAVSSKVILSSEVVCRKVKSIYSKSLNTLCLTVDLPFKEATFLFLHIKSHQIDSLPFILYTSTEVRVEWYEVRDSRFDLHKV